MQPIQDKDFDQLFKNTFEDAEIMPSKDFWSNIESEIEPKKRRIIPVYWLSAAAVLLIATVGILIYRQQDLKRKQYANNIAPKIEKSVVIEQPRKDSSTLVKVPVEIPAKTYVARNRSEKTTNKIKVKENEPVEKQKVVTAPEMQKQEILIASVEEPKKDLKTKIDEAILKTKEETVLASNANKIDTGEVAEESDQNENKSIRNVGDVVNLIVNKMDKRKDKLIQFRTDDDDSSISSINIGPFKIGKKSRK